MLRKGFKMKQRKKKQKRASTTCSDDSTARSVHNQTQKGAKRKADDNTDVLQSKKLKLDSSQKSDKQNPKGKRKFKKGKKRRFGWDISTSASSTPVNSVPTHKENIHGATSVSPAGGKHRKKQNVVSKGATQSSGNVKVQTHAALYRNPEEFSSNWKELMKELCPKKENQKSKFKKKTKSRGVDSTTTKLVKDVKKPSSASPSKENKEKPDIWFDDVDEDLLELSDAEHAGKEKCREDEKPIDMSNPLVKETTVEGLTKAVAMDCEMVGVGAEGKDSVLARVSIVNQFGKCVYDKFVKPREDVTDFRTQFSGIRPEDLKNAENFSTVQKEVYEIMKGRILVGHALKNDLKVLYLDHPQKKLRDTARYRGFRKLFQGKTPSLKKLTGKVLGVSVQEGEHDSVEDAQAAMRLYTMHKIQWEKELKLKYKKLIKPAVSMQVKD